MATNLSNASVFNPEVKDTQDPNYLNLSRPISDQKNYGTALSEGLKGAAELGTDVVKVAHTLTQQTLDEKIHSDINEAREKEKADLDATLYNVSGGKAGVKGEVLADATLLSGGTADTPPAGLQNLDQTLGSIEGAGPGPRGNGRLSRTDYAARLDTLAKDIRSQYPGWTDYIDQKFKSVTGMDPANAVVAGRIADINSWITSKKTTKDKISDLFTAHYRDEPEMVQVRQDHIDGKINDNQALSKMQEWNSNENLLKHAETQWKLEQGTNQNRQLKAEIYARELATNTINKRMSAVSIAFGLGRDPVAAAEAISKADPERQNQFQANMREGLKFAAIEIQQKLSVVDPVLKRSAINDLASGTLDKLVNDASTVYNGFTDSIQKKQTDLAKFYSDGNEVLLNRNTHQIITSQELGRRALDAASLTKLWGPNATSTIMTDLLKSNLTGAYQTYATNVAIRAAAGTVNTETGTVTNLSQDVAAAVKAVDTDPGLTEEQKVKVKAGLTNTFIKQIESIQDPAVPEEWKRKYVARAFSPAGRDLIRKIEDEGIAPDGSTVKGKYSVYNRLFTPQMSQEVFLLGGPEWRMYKDSAKSWLQRDLLAPDVAKLNQIALDPDMKLTWDDKNYKFGIVPGRGINTPETFGDPLGVRRVLTNDPGFNASLEATRRFIDDRLNPALYSYRNVAGRDEEDINAFMYGTLKQMGLGGVDKIMLNAIEASAKQKQKKVSK